MEEGHCCMAYCCRHCDTRCNNSSKLTSTSSNHSYLDQMPMAYPTGISFSRIYLYTQSKEHASLTKRRPGDLFCKGCAAAPDVQRPLLHPYLYRKPATSVEATTDVHLQDPIPCDSPSGLLVTSPHSVSTHTWPTRLMCMAVSLHNGF